MNIDLTKYDEVNFKNTNIKQQLFQLGMLGFFKVGISFAGSHKSTKSYTILEVVDDALLLVGGRKITKVSIPGLTKLSSDGTIFLNWCTPGYIGYGEWPIELYLSETVSNLRTSELVQISVREDTENKSELRAYMLRKTSEEKPMDLSREIQELKKEVEQLRELLADKTKPTAPNIPKIPKALSMYYKPSEAMQLISQGYENLKYIHTQTENICIQAVRASPYALRYVHKQTTNICIAAVDRDPLALQFVENQTPEICKRALQKDQSAISFIRTPTPELINYAIESGKGKSWGNIAGSVLMLSAQADTTPYDTFKQLVYQSPHFLAYVPEKMRTQELILIALDRSYQAIALLEDQAPYLEYVVTKSWEALSLIRNVPPSLYEFALDVHRKPATSENPTGLNHIPVEWIMFIDLLSLPWDKANLLLTRAGLPISN